MLAACVASGLFVASIPLVNFISVCQSEMKALSLGETLLDFQATVAISCETFTTSITSASRDHRLVVMGMVATDSNQSIVSNQFFVYESGKLEVCSNRNGKLGSGGSRWTSLSSSCHGCYRHCSRQGCKL